MSKHVPPPEGEPLSDLCLFVPAESAGLIESGLAIQERQRAVALSDLRRLRKEASAEIERLLDFLDASDPYTSTELEAELGHPEPSPWLYQNPYLDYPSFRSGLDQTNAPGCCDARESDLASTEHEDKTRIFSVQDSREIEDEHTEENGDELDASYPESTESGHGARLLGHPNEDDEDNADFEPDDSGIADADGLMEQCPELFQHQKTKVLA